MISELNHPNRTKLIPNRIRVFSKTEPKPNRNEKSYFAHPYWISAVLKKQPCATDSSALILLCFVEILGDGVKLLALELMCSKVWQFEDVAGRGQICSAVILRCCLMWLWSNVHIVVVVCQWIVESFRTEQGHCGACRMKWRLTDTDLCPCGETQTMFHIVESCPLTKLNGILSRLHSAD